MSGLREEQKERRRADILIAAKTLFRTRGYNSTKIEDIARVARVSSVTVFNYYGTKGALLLAIITEETENIIDQAKSGGHEDDSEGIEIIASLFDVVIRESFRNLDKESWKHVIASSIIESESSFSVSYNNLRDMLKSLLIESILNIRNIRGKFSREQASTIADVAYAYHYQLFTELVSRRDMTIDSYGSRLRRGLETLVPTLHQLPVQRPESGP